MPGTRRRVTCQRPMFGTWQMPYVFDSVDQLLDDFLADIAAWKGD